MEKSELGNLMNHQKFQEIKTILGKPAFEADKVAIYQMDCLEAMKKIPEGLVDLTVTSPPYNIGKEYEDISSVEAYVKWCQTWMQEIHRLTKSDGSFWLNLGFMPVDDKGFAVPIPYLLWDKSDFYFHQEVVWNYAAGVACKKRFSHRNEKFLWYLKDPKNYTFNLDAVRDPDVKYPNQKKNGKLRCNPLGKNPSDVWQITKVTSGRNRSSKERTPHPAQFPLALIERVIKASSNVGDLILDPFMGSGSTAECALQNDRYTIGFELNSEYIGYAEARILNYLEEKKAAEAQVELVL
ncbi:DNA-methyltransferase [Vibrio splendidus]|uniref:DNA-methyltransferase n=1 Tax=Vibrio splendidus TaxID=29497 RepID=UPI0018E4D39C|nr:site-specific DNA-methyltransferase [Vibrio splendidus]